MLLQSVRHTYEVAGLLAVTSTYRLRLAQARSTGDWCLLQIANDPKYNGGLSRAAYILNELTIASRGLDDLYGKRNDGKHLHYDRLFPAILETFVTGEDQGKRRVNALSLTEVKDVPRLLPLSVPLAKHQRVLDLKTGAWVLGRLLKLLGFAHEQGIAVRSLRPNNVILDTDQHFAIVLDWTSAQVFQDKVSDSVARTDIVRATEAILVSCGVSSNGAPYPYPLTGNEQQYIDLLRRFAEGKVRNASEAHTQFYQIVRDIWDTEFHPFTSLPLAK